MTELHGIPVAGGSRVGPALLYEETLDVAIPLSPAGDVADELARLGQAVSAALEALAGLRESLGGDQSIGEIFRVHAVMLDAVRPEIEEAIEQGAGAEQAVARVMHAHAQRFATSENPMLAQRRRDIVDLERRLLRLLAGSPAEEPASWDGERPVVVVARDLTPSETAALEGKRVAALALEEGGATSHTAVIAKSLGIPCVVGVDGLTARVRPGDPLWVDGTRGVVVIDPDPDTVARARGLGERYERLEETLLRESHLPAETLDGHRAVLLANVEFPLDVEAGVARGAEGVGLYRTEFLYDAERGLPTEEDHLRAYRETLARIGNGCLTVRTFDFGADKESPQEGAREPNPALGIRSLRWCFAHPDVFRTQLRALLRAAAEGDVRIMLPMVGSLEELRRAKAMIRQTARELATEGMAHRADLPIGIMIEIPAAALTADLLAREVDFFSIGTNDLIQYDLAVDRVNARVASLFRPSHPSLLRLLQQTIQAATDARIPVTMCGEMGGHSIYTVLLFGMGLRSFSLTPGYIPRARRLLRSLTLRRARSVAAHCLRLGTADEVEALLHARVTPVGAG
ncbi:MAG: phosphoenolpyruvate--protein phosphotransferase [Planctomycetota bacterium]|jgi:phosphotransferase system enzyme I (PtsI)